MIYLAHYGLREPPFSITPDTTFFFACNSTQEALNTLMVALSTGEGFLKITGEVGTGKTLLCRKFIASLDDSWVTAYIPNPHLDPRTLLLALAQELGLKQTDQLDQHMLVKRLNQALLDFARAKKRVVVCLDECQAMPIESLETLRLLTNLETEKRKLLQVVLFGQPELDDKLATESIRQLRQRITFQYHLGAMSSEETRHYLRHRLAVAGYRGEPLFSDAAARAIFRAGRGVPRLVNIVAHKSMMYAYGKGLHRIGRRAVIEAVRDTPAARAISPLWAWVALACLAGAGATWMLLL